MATQVERLLAFVSAVGADIKALFTRSPPAGGTTGQALVKTSNGNYAFGWATIEGGTGGGGSSSGPGWRVQAVGTGSAQVVALPAVVAATDILVFINGLAQNVDDYLIAGSNLTLTTYSGAEIMVMLRTEGGRTTVVTRSQLNTLAAAEELAVGGMYIVSDESRLAVVVTESTYQFYSPSIRGIPWQIVGKTAANEIYPAFAPYAFTSTTARSFARARVAATAETVFTVKRNGTTVATVTFAIGAATGTWSANVTWADGDLATIEPPATPDATLADIVIGARE